MRAVLAAWILSAASLFAGPSLVLPKEVKGEPGAFLRIAAETPGKVVKWRVVDGGLNLFPVDLLRDSKVAVVVALKPGRYRLQAVTALADEPSDIVETVVVVGNAPPPGPDPVPPGPDPTPPDPADPLAKALQTLYVATADPDKAKHVKALASIYRQGAEFISTGDIATAGDLFGRLSTVSASLLPRVAIQSLRDEIANELKKTLPANPATALTAEHRATAKKLFIRLASILEGIAK